MCSLELKTTSLEERIHRTYWEDGSLDLLVGLVVLLIGISWLEGLVALSAVAPALGIPLWMAMRRGLVEPRLGHVIFAKSRRERERRGMTSVLSAGVGVLVLAVLGWVVLRQTGGAGETLGAMVAGLPAFLLGGLGIACGLLFGMPRLTLYGGAAMVLAGMGILLNWEPHWQILFAGVIPSITGAVLLANFLWKYPRVTEEGNGDEAA